MYTKTISDALLKSIKPYFPKGPNQEKSDKQSVVLSDKIMSLTKKIGVSYFELEGGDGGDFNKIWFFDFNKLTKNRGGVYLVVLHSETQMCDVLRIAESHKNFTVGYIVKLLAAHKKSPFPIKQINGVEGQREISLQAFSQEITRVAHVTSLKIQREFKSAANVSNKSARPKDMFLQTLVNDSQRLMNDLHDDAVESIKALIDLQSMQWAENIYNYDVLHPQYTQFDIYNHIVSAETLEARGYRYTALQQYAKLGDLYMDAPFWKDIDAGQSPLWAIADYWDVDSSTVKHIIGAQGLFLTTQRALDNLAVYLNVIDRNYWPQNKLELFYFIKCIEVAELYEGTFFGPSVGYMMKWVQQNRHRAKRPKKAKGRDVSEVLMRKEENPPNIYWHKMAFRLLKSQIYHMKGNPEKYLSFFRKEIRDALKVENAISFGDIINIPFNLKNVPGLWNKTIKLFGEHVSDIRDMKRDVGRRIIFPALLLELTKKGYQVTEAGILKGLSEHVEKIFWGGMSPSDQIEASAYWHSGHVNVQRRFKAAVIQNGSYAQWPFLLGADVFKLDDNIYIHPLCSSAALDVESDVMSISGKPRFCIWSYSAEFYTSDYHMMSIRDEAGERICVLTVRDYFDTDGRRKVQHIQNKKKGNANPDRIGRDAANMIIEGINNNKIEVDWMGIDEARAGYKIRQIENAAGYDIYDGMYRQTVFDVYWPCLRHSIHSGDRTFEGLSEALKIEQIVSEFLKEFDFSQGGLISDKSFRVVSTKRHPNQPKAVIG